MIFLPQFNDKIRLNLEIIHEIKGKTTCLKRTFEEVIKHKKKI